MSENALRDAFVECVENNAANKSRQNFDGQTGCKF